MASVLDKVMAKVEKLVAKKTAKAARKQNRRLTDCKAACGEVTGLEYLASTDKTTIVAFADRKIGVVNSSGIQAAAVNAEGKVAYVKLSASEFADWAKAMVVKITAEEKASK